MSYPPPPPYPAMAAPTGPVRLRGRTPLLIAAILTVVAVALFVVGGVVLAKKSLGKVNDFQRVPLASSGTVTFDHAGRYVAYYEADNVDSDTHSVPKVPVALRSPSGQERVLDTPYGGRTDNKVKIFTYEYNSHHGIALWQFNISEKGRYDVQVGPNDLAAPGADIAFGESIAGGTVVGGLLIVLGVLFIIAAIVLLIVGLVKRRNSRQEQAGPFGGYGPPPAYGAGYPQGYPGAGYPQGYPAGGPPQGYAAGGPPQGYPAGGPPQGYPGGYSGGRPDSPSTSGGGYPPPSG